MKIVGIYKIPPKWESIENKMFKYNSKIIYDNIENIANYKEHANRITNIKNNLYFELFFEIFKTYKNAVGHYIFVDETLNKAVKSVIKGISVWILKSHEEMCNFIDSDIFFFRGNYTKYYENIKVNNSKRCKIIFYPATSFVYNYEKKNQNDSFRYPNINCLLKKNSYISSFYKNIDIALIHENPDYLKVFKFSKNILFNKPASNIFKYLDLVRENDIIFIADAIQTTKNHQLMFNFMSYCEKNKKEIKILYVSNKNTLKKTYTNFFEENQCSFVKLNYITNISPEELNILMNKSKINLILSGRDAFPRTITESLYAGCYNVALNTLSDGKNMYTSIFGKIINSNDNKLVLLKSRSLSYIGDNNIWDKIIELIKHNYNHKEISEEAIKNFNIKNIVSKIILNLK